MIKKTNKIKGGKTFIEKLVGTNFDGPFVADNIYDRVKKGKAIDTREEFKLRKELADDEYKIAENKFKNRGKDIQLEADRNFKYDKLSQDNFNVKLKIFINLIGNLISGFKKNVIDTIINFFNKILYPIISKIIEIFFKLFEILISLFELGDGAIVKIICLIVIIAICIGLGFYFFSPAAGGGGGLSSATNKNNMDIFVKTPEPSFLASIPQIIPDKYMIQFTSFKNYINKALGNDLLAKSINSIKRDTTNEGSYNGITNIRIDDGSNIYSLLKPKDQIWEIKLNDFKDTNIDFHKLPDDVKIDILKEMEKNFFKSFPNDIKEEIIKEIRNKNLSDINFGILSDNLKRYILSILNLENIDIKSLSDNIKKDIIKKFKENFVNIINFEENKIKYQFKVINDPNTGKYRYQINPSLEPLIKTDPNLLNNFIINKQLIKPISITDKDINQDKENLMFSYSDKTFKYPDNLENKINKY